MQWCNLTHAWYLNSIKRFFNSRWNSPSDLQAAGLASAKWVPVLQKCVPTPPKRSDRAAERLCALCSRAARSLVRLCANTWLPQSSSVFPHVPQWSDCLSRCTRHIPHPQPHFPSPLFFFHLGAYLATRVFPGDRGTGFTAAPFAKAIPPPVLHTPSHHKPEALTINPPSYMTMQTLQSLYFNIVSIGK